jgi:heme exporter protein C
VLALGLGLLVAPPDAVQGQAQRLMYVHVPAAWTGFMALGLVALASIMILLGGGRRWDAVARAGSEIGVPMMGLAIVEGSIWGHSAWGVWWAWDPRLVTTALLWLTYVGYMALRWATVNEKPGASAARARHRLALVGAVAVVEIPVAHFSVLWWRSLHQPPTILRPSLSDPIAGSMLVALLVSLLAFTLAAAWFVLTRYEQLLSAAPRPVTIPPPSRVAPPAQPSVTRSTVREPVRR